MASVAKRVPRVLLTNDDGPPSPNSSPFIYPFALALREQLGWDVKVVIPSTQKSWVGSSYLISQVTTGQYYYPLKPDGMTGEKTDLPRPLREGEDMEMVLIDGTPSMASNLGLYSIYPSGTFDLVIGGPNYGRNTSTAFGLSSGTIGTAMGAGLTGIPAIALSFGLMEGHKGPGPAYDALVAAGIKASCNVVKGLWELGFEEEGPNRVDFYSINVPLLPSLLKEPVDVQFTTMARTNYQRLFKSIGKNESVNKGNEAGPGAIPEKEEESKIVIPEDSLLFEDHHTKPLKFVFSPDITSLLNPSPSSLMVGSDTHALHSGSISITPLRAAFEPVAAPKGLSKIPGSLWKL